MRPAQRSLDNSDGSACCNTSTAVQTPSTLFPFPSADSPARGGVTSTVLPPQLPEAVTGADRGREGRPNKVLIAGTNRHPYGAFWRLRRPSKRVSGTNLARRGACLSPAGPGGALSDAFFYADCCIFLSQALRDLQQSPPRAFCKPCAAVRACIRSKNRDVANKQRLTPPPTHELRVSYEEREAAKERGARWHPTPSPGGRAPVVGRALARPARRVGEVAGQGPRGLPAPDPRGSGAERPRRHERGAIRRA